MIGPRIVDKPLVLYGYGKLGHLAEEIFNELKIPIARIIDKRLQPTWQWPVGPNPDKALIAICVATEPYDLVIAPLVSAGWTDIVPVWDIIEAYPEVGMHNGWFAGPERKGEPKKILQVMEYFDDRISQQHYDAFIEWHHDRQEPEIPSIVIELEESLPSTLADIRNRQKVAVYADVPMDSISIHNEGCELKTLEINMPLFQKYRPKIDVACYHSRDGLWGIEKLLMDNLPNYIWTFRLTAYMGQGAYIYGTPKEKI